VRISPLDIRKQAFKKSLRGVDAEEVRIFLELVASEYEKVLQENAMMAEKIRHQDERLAEYRELEKSMRNSLVTADRIASESREASERDAARLVQDAQARAERILEDARERLHGLIGEIETLKGKKQVYARRFWTLVEGQIGMLQEHLQDVGEVEALRQRVGRLIDRARPDTDRLRPADRAPETDESEEESEPEPAFAPPPHPADQAAEAQAERPRGLPRGLGRLLRSRQQSPPSAEPPARDARGGNGTQESDLFPIRQRPEGQFDLTANDEEAAHPRPTGPRP